MHIKKLPTQYYIDLIAANQVFAFPRYGDGEWAWILDIPHVNEEGHGWTPGLAADLRQSIIASHSLPFYYTMPQLELLYYPTEIVHWLKNLPQNSPDFYDCSCFRIDSHTGRLYPLIEQLRQKKILVIGPPFLRELSTSGLFSPAGFVDVPERNAYAAKESVLHQILQQPHSFDLLAFSAGPLSNILIDRLWGKINTSMIDFGSLWDVYLGRNTRRYMQAMTPAIFERKPNDFYFSSHSAAG